MALIDHPGAGLPRAPVTVDLDDIQATVLRCRPEPYYGTHIMLHVDEAKGGREFVRRLAELSRSVPGRDGRARRPAPRLRTERPGTLGRAVRERAHPYRGQRLQRLGIH